MFKNNPKLVGGSYIKFVIICVILRLSEKLVVNMCFIDLYSLIEIHCQFPTINTPIEIIYYI